MSGLARRGRLALGRRVDSASLGAFRIAFGLVQAWGAARYLIGDRVERYYVEPSFHFHYLGFGWVRPWPQPWMDVHFAVLGATAIGVVVGWRYRACALLHVLLFGYAFLLEKARYLNHHYLILLLGALLVLVPADRSLAIGGRRGASPLVPYAALFVLRAQVGLVYLFAGIAKLNADWLRGEPLRSWLAARADHPFWGGILTEGWAPWAFSYGGLALDLLAWPLLAWRRTRPVTFLVLVAFHLANAAIFDIGVFPWMMIAATSLFFDPGWPRRIAVRASAAPAPRAESAGPPRPLARGWTAALALHLAVQAAVPLRHLLYPGGVSWTEEGHRFSWHMKLRDKDAAAMFLVRRRDGDEEWLVDPRGELADWQVRKMSGRPDMIHEYAIHLARSGRFGTAEEVEVYATVSASLNHRPPAPLVDPAVDLSREPRGLGRARWILPLPEDATIAP